jgi:hypothetical protein
MSQSDYIKLLKTTEVLRNGKLPSVLTPEYYTAFETYNLETTVPNTKNSYSRLQQSGYQTIFGMEKKVSGCPTFAMCTNTNTRPNRVLHSAQIPRPIYRMNKVYTPIKCQIKKGYVVRSATCSKHKCKCRTRVLSAA